MDQIQMWVCLRNFRLIERRRNTRAENLMKKEPCQKDTIWIVSEEAVLSKITLGLPVIVTYYFRKSCTIASMFGAETNSDTGSAINGSFRRISLISCWQLEEGTPLRSLPFKFQVFTTYVLDLINFISSVSIFTHETMWHHRVWDQHQFVELLNGISISIWVYHTVLIWLVCYVHRLGF